MRIRAIDYELLRCWVMNIQIYWREERAVDRAKANDDFNRLIFPVGLTL